MEEAIRKARVLVEALGWIRRFRGKYIVIKLGGSALEERDAVARFLGDVIFMETVGMKPIVVHGGGKAISQAMADAGLEPQFVHGRRYTDEATLEIVSRVLAEEICPSLVGEIERQGGQASGLNYSTRNCLIASKLSLPDEAGEEVDLGAVGQVTGVEEQVIEQTFAAGCIPVIPSIALDDSGNKLNVNADTAAAAVARLLHAEKLVFLSDVPGIYLDPSDSNTLISHLEATRCRELIEQGVIDRGMIPKVDASLEALDAGVRKVHIVDAGMPHSVLLEIYSDKGIGTEIVL